MKFSKNMMVYVILFILFLLILYLLTCQFAKKTNIEPEFVCPLPNSKQIIKKQKLNDIANCEIIEMIVNECKGRLNILFTGEKQKEMELKVKIGFMVELVASEIYETENNYPLSIIKDNMKQSLTETTQVQQDPSIIVISYYLNNRYNVLYYTTLNNKSVFYQKQYSKSDMFENDIDHLFSQLRDELKYRPSSNNVLLAYSNVAYPKIHHNKNNVNSSYPSQPLHIDKKTTEPFESYSLGLTDWLNQDKKENFESVNLKGLTSWLEHNNKNEDKHKNNNLERMRYSNSHMIRKNKNSFNYSTENYDYQQDGFPGIKPVEVQYKL